MDNITTSLVRNNPDSVHNAAHLQVVNSSNLRRVTKLGRGSLTDVFHVVDKASRSQFALKCLDDKRLQKCSAGASDDAANDLTIEALTLSRLDHNNIIKVRGVSSSLLQDSRRDSSNFFLLVDLLDETLHGRLRSWRRDERLTKKKKSSFGSSFKTLAIRRLTGRKIKSKPNDVMLNHIATEVRSIALEITKAMIYLHGQGIILRDLKPANVGFDEGGVLKLFDFGMARNIKDCPSNKICGTPRYMAPEVMLGEGYSLECDVYSFGVMLYELCSLQVPFSEWSTLTDLRRAVAYNGFRPSLNSIPSQEMRALIASCWSQRPADRPSFLTVYRILANMSLQDDVTKKNFLSQSQHTASTAYTSTVEDIGEDEDATKLQ